jgi:DNA-binding NtrC family response regulator
MALLPDNVADLVVATLDLGEMPGLRMLQFLKEHQPGVPIIAITSRPTVEGAVAAVLGGARDYMGKPSDPSRLRHTILRILREGRAHRELLQTREQVRDRYGFRNLLSRSPVMLKVFDQIRAVAPTDANVLIRGETGTGKELVARAIHERSKRKDRPCVSVNCGAFTETLLESELFGHEKGSFTGASARREGVFEMADGGTLFLDELGETSLSVQVNLLRVLDEMAFRRVGGEKLIHVDVRIIAATNQDLETHVKRGLFRQDLFYRLNVFPLFLPPLRERREDVPLLLRHFLDSAAEEYETEPPIIAQDAMDAILAYGWPGNVRQLRAICERWVIVAGGRTLSLDMLPADFLTGRELAASMAPSLELDETRPMREQIDAIVAGCERGYLERLLTRHQGNVQEAARAAGFTRRTLYNKLEVHGIEPDAFRNPPRPGESPR